MVSQLYRCDTCRTVYNTSAEANACEAQGLPTGINVGDIITKYDGYGWHTGPDYWIAEWLKERRSADGRPNRHFYWLVIGIEPMRSLRSVHHNTLTLVSRGIVNGYSVDGKGEWGVFRLDHYVARNYGVDPRLVSNPPPKVKADADAFIARGYTIGRDGNVKLRKENR
jgi:hypothetical protein